MEDEDDGVDNETEEVSNIDHRGDMRPRPIITPPMRHLIPIVQEVLAEIRIRFWDVNRQDEEDGANAQGPAGPPAPLQGEMEAEVHSFINTIPTVHPVIAVLKHVITVIENEGMLEETDDDAIRWSTQTLQVVDVSPDHPLLSTANEIIELCDGRLYEDDDEEDDGDESDFFVEEEEEEEEEELDPDENAAEDAGGNANIDTGDNINYQFVDDVGGDADGPDWEET